MRYSLTIIDNCPHFNDNRSDKAHGNLGITSVPCYKSVDQSVTPLLIADVIAEENESGMKKGPKNRARERQPRIRFANHFGTLRFFLPSNLISNNEVFKKL